MEMQFVLLGNRRCVGLCAYRTLHELNPPAAVVPEYFCNLDGNSLRLDHLQRPELNKGTVDFAVSEEYWAPHPAPRLTPSYQSVEPPSTSKSRTPLAMDYVFAFDLSAEGIQSGFVKAAADAVLACLYGSTDNENPLPPRIAPASRVAVMSFDRSLHFYDLSVCSPLDDHTLNLLTYGFSLSQGVPVCLW